MTDDTAPALPITATVTAPHPIEMDATLMARLAHELAMDIEEQGAVLRRYNIDPVEFVSRIKENSFFKRAYDAAVLEWNSAASTDERIKMKTKYGFEHQVLPNLLTRAADAHDTLSSVTSAAALAAKIAGIDGTRQPGQAGSGEKFSITIDLGGDTKIKYEREITSIDGDGENATIQINTEGKGGPASIPKVVEATAVPSPIQSEPQGAGDGQPVRPLANRG